MIIKFTERQKKILEIVKENEPITGQEIADLLGFTRATLRSDLAILTMTGVLDARPKVGYFYTGKSSINLLTQKVKNIKIKDIMSIPIVVTENVSVYDAIVTMFLDDVGTIFVTSENFLAGVVSRKDFLKIAIGGANINKMPVAMIMTRMPNIKVVTPDENILLAVDKIVQNEIDSLPVVEKEVVGNQEKYRVVGRISKSNITKLFLELCTE